MTDEEYTARLIAMAEGARPKYYRGRSAASSYWLCGHCSRTGLDVIDNFCPKCGYRIKWDRIRTLTGIKEPEEVPDGDD